MSAFDVVMREPIPRKGAVLTQISAFWFERLGGVVPSHYVTARRRRDRRSASPRSPAARDEIAGRAMLVRRTTPVPFECVVRGYLSGSAWAEYRAAGTLAGEPLPAGLARERTGSSRRSSRPPPRPRAGHDENVTFDRDGRRAGRASWPTRLRDASFAVYRAGRDHAAARGIIIADTKFEFGTARRRRRCC